jgi:hypothetical protein
MHLWELKPTLLDLHDIEKFELNGANIKEIVSEDF